MVKCYTECAGNQICMSDCSRMFTTCEEGKSNRLFLFETYFLACPCGKDCPVGCSGCDHPLCTEPPSTEPPTTESSTMLSSTESSSTDSTSSTSESTSRSTSSTRSHPTTSSTTKSSSITRTLTTSRTSRSTLPSLPDSKCGVMYSCGEPISQGVSA